MQRFLIAMLLCLGLTTLASQQAEAQYLKEVSGYLLAGETMVFYPRVPNNSAQDTIYRISGTFSISGRLVIQPGAEVHFLPNSRILDSTGGKIIANACGGRQIEFRGVRIPGAVEWGHFLILPGADSTYFSNVRFTNFRKGLTVDNTLLYGAAGTAIANSLAINAEANGVGAVMTTFSRKTWVLNAIVDSCQSTYRAGAFAFLQAPAASYFPSDDGRLALVNGQVGKLTIRDTRAYNTSAADPNTLGGAIYMAARVGATSADFLTAYLGNRSTDCFTASQDMNLFERCSANNTNSGATQVAKGGAIYVGRYTALVAQYITCNNDSAIAAQGDLNAWGGAIAVSPTSGNPSFLPPPSPAFDHLPGLAILKQADFNTNVAGLGGAIHTDANLGQFGPVLNIDGENINSSTGIRDSGNIIFRNNIAYREGGAVFGRGYTYIKGYLAPSEGVLNNSDYRSIELRVKFENNVAGVAGGSLYLDPNYRTDLLNRRVWHLNNSVNPSDARVGRPALTNQVLGGGAEYVGWADSTFATEYHGNFTIGGNGGAVSLNTAQSGPPNFPVNRFFVEDKYNAGDVRIAPIPFDPRELTRFCDNHAYLGPDSSVLFGSRGRGGALYVNVTNKTNPILSVDSTFISRGRFEQNFAYTGSAIYSDNFDLRIIADLTLIANNHATSPSSRNVDLVGSANPSDPNAGATVWAEFEGPLPSYESNSRGNAIYDNTGRYILRLPDGPTGSGGVDTLRGNFWGDTGPDLVTRIPNTFALQRTFFIDYYNSCFTNVFEPNYYPATGYTPTFVGTIPDTTLMEGRVYDIFDKGTDIKTADYNNRRLAIAESFALGLPTDLQSIHRYTRNFFTTDSTYINRILNPLQTDFVGPHPIGYPLFLQANVSPDDNNRDACAKNYTVLYVLNTTTNEFVRVNAKETAQDGPVGATQLYRGRLDFVPDSSVATRHPFQRATVLYTLNLLRPQIMTFAEIQRASKLEDSAALMGRSYLLPYNQYQGIGADSVCVQGINTTDTNRWYAGERYHTLPVRPGDNILVVSRTQLWKYGAAGAIARGLQFTIGDVLPPSFSSDITTIMNAPINPNRKFIREDVNYDLSSNSTLVRIAGYDVNNFYDPRFQFDPARFTQLRFDVTVGQDSAHDRLFRWLKDTTFYNMNVTGSNGYVQLYGQPHNPDVVPGGEPITVKITNFPPNFGSQGGLDTAGFNLGPNGKQLSMFTFPAYFNCPSGFQTDTLCVRSSSTSYQFRLFVIDSLPVFTSTPSRACAANLTDSLRYEYDVQTDDESEDSVAVEQGWGFPYGRTSYSFEVAPTYFSSVANSPAFRTDGKISLRIDSATAINLLRPVPQINGEFNLDTTIVIRADDGHAGRELQQFRLPINVAPTILTTSLPNAKEDIDYSLDFQDTTRVIRILTTDPNIGDVLTYKLIRKGETDSVYRDSKFKTGLRVVKGTTPLWLNIDPFSGVLSGTPGQNDAPHTVADIDCGGPDTVMVLVTDQCGLTALSLFQLQVDSTVHPPRFARGPRELCVTNKQDFCDSLLVIDHDLTRDTCSDDLTFKVIEPAELTVTPSTISGTASDTQRVKICGRFNKDNNYFEQTPIQPIAVRVAVTDRYGNADTLTYKVHIGDIPTFECAITVSNVATQTHEPDMQRLCFGAGRFGSDSLDIRYCEMEIPPPGPAPVFDARWELPIGGRIKGTYIDIRRDTNQFTQVAWQVRLQAGNEGSTFLFPLKICWRPSCFDSTAPFSGNFYIQNPNDVREFSINMRTGEGLINPSFYSVDRVGADSLCLTIKNVGLANARIVFLPTNSAVEESSAPKFALEQNFPNPFNPSTMLSFSVGNKSDVKIEVFDIKGSLVRTLVNENVNTGANYPVMWDGMDAAGNVMPSGTYVAKMTAGNFTSSVKMTLKK